LQKQYNGPSITHIDEHLAQKNTLKLDKMLKIIL